MSWNYTVALINHSLERMVSVYNQFIHRTEQSFRALHQRLMYLEERQAWQGPSDEQVERVMRKILAERFSDAGVQRVENPNVMKEGDYFVEDPKADDIIPRIVPIDLASFQIDPDQFPSKQYEQTLQSLESRVSTSPPDDLSKTGRDTQHQHANGSPTEFKRPKLPADSH